MEAGAKSSDNETKILTCPMKSNPKPEKRAAIPPPNRGAQSGQSAATGACSLGPGRKQREPCRPLTQTPGPWDPFVRCPPCKAGAAGGHRRSRESEGRCSLLMGRGLCVSKWLTEPTQWAWPQFRALWVGSQKV